MLSYQISSKVGALLLSISAGEQEIERYRQNVCKFKDFEPYAAYQRIERRKGGFITAKGIVNFLADNKIYYSEEQCGIFIQRFDLDGDQELSYSEFLNASLPFENPLLRTVTSQRANYKVTVKQYLPTKIEEALAQLIDKEISFYLNLDLQKARLVQQKDFSFEVAFDTIDKYSTERIDFDNLMTFFRGQAMYPDRRDVIAILRRIDREDKGYIFLKELVAELQPLTYTAMKTTKKAELCQSQRQQIGQSVQIQNSLLLSERERDRDAVVISARIFHQNQEFLSPVKDEKNSGRRHQGNMSAASTAFGTTMKSKEPINVVDEAGPEQEHPVEVKKELKFGGPTSGELGFISILRQILSFTKELENAKDELAAQPDWNIFAFFGSFKPEKRVYLTESHLIEGLKKYGVFPNKDELRLLFSSLDKDRDDIIGQRDFEDLLLPLNYELSIAVRNRGPFFKDTQLSVDRLFSLDTRRKINKVMSLCLENEGIFENLRRKLHDTTTFEIRDAFDKVDIKNEGFVSSEALEDFLKAYDWHPTQREINCLMTALDLNKDGRISYVEFAHGLTPRSLL